MKRIFCLLTLVLQLACSNKEVQLPMLAFEGAGEIHNHSGIWIFCEVTGQDTLAAMNKNNKLQNTHWIFHIDKRLPMREIAPMLNEMQEDHDKESMHKKQGMLNYYSFADSVNQKMSLLLFRKTMFNFTDPDEWAEVEQDTCLTAVEIRQDGLILKGSGISAEHLKDLASQKASCPDASGAVIQLGYSENLRYLDYLKAKAQLDSRGLVTGEKEWLIRKK